MFGPAAGQSPLRFSPARRKGARVLAVWRPAKQMSGFAAIGRARQARFRDASPTISDAARTPDDQKGRRHGHLLALGHEEENLFPPLRGADGARQFFTARRIAWWRSGRSGDAKGLDAPTRNLASSQVSCVNFLLPLAGVRGALVALLRAIDPRVAEVLPLRYAGLSSPVEFEWTGFRTTLEGRPPTRGALVTSADALIVARKQRGGRCAYLFEWKCVEAYPVGKWLGHGSSGRTRLGRYSSPYATEGSSFTGAFPLGYLLYEPLYQLTRLRLLADKMVREAEFGISEAKVVAACPRENAAYRETITSPPLRERLRQAKTIEDAFRAVLREPAGFTMTSQEDLIGALRRSDAVHALTEWFTYHHERYGW